MDFFASLSPDLRAAVVGALIGAFASILTVAFGGIGWLVRARSQAKIRRQKLRRIKMHQVMDWLVKTRDWWGGEHGRAQSIPVDHIVWLCEAYGQSERLTDAAKRLFKAAYGWEFLADPVNEFTDLEVEQRVAKFNVEFNKAYNDVYNEVLAVLRQLNT